jgi:hypothetical protein
MFSDHADIDISVTGFCKRNQPRAKCEQRTERRLLSHLSRSGNTSDNPSTCRYHHRIDEAHH